MASNEHLLSVIKKIAEEQKFQNYDIKVTRMSTGGPNFTSTLNVIKITEKGKDDLNLFAKVALSSESLRNNLPMDPFKNEVLAYTNLFKAYRRLEKKHGVSERDRLNFPKFYGADQTHMQEILVLENVTIKGFGQANRFKSVDWPYAAAAVTELAKFHALSIAYQHEEPSEFNIIHAEFPRGGLPDTETNNVMFKSAVESALTEIREENKDKLKRFLEGKNLITYMYDMFKPLSLEVFIHVDFRPSNMLHRTRDDGSVDMIIVDYQTIHSGCPVTDLLNFIFSATDGQFRKKYYQKLVDRYHSELGAALARFGLDVEDKYPSKVFEFEFKERLAYGLMTSILTLPILTMAEDDAPALDEELNMASFANKKTGELYRQRINEAVDHFVEYGLLN